MRRFLVVPAVLLLVACGGGSTGGGAVGGSSSPGLQASDLPSGFAKCPQSGDLKSISDSDTKGEFQYQQKQGATGGDVEVYAGSSGDCKAMPDFRGGSAKLIASAVLNFKDAASAKTAYDGGIYGVQSKSLGSGGSAGLKGDSSAYSYSAGGAAAAWLKGSTVTVMVAQGLAESDFKKAAQAVNGRS